MYPVLFTIGNFPVSPYGILIAVGMLLAVWSTTRRTRTLQIADEHVIDIAVWAIVGGLFGAKLLFIITVWSEFLQAPAATLFRRDGLVFYGGLLVGIPAVYWFLVRRKLPVWCMADAIAPAISLAHTFGRIGCFFAGCCYGKVCSADNPFGISFPRRGEIVPNALMEQIEHFHLPETATESLPVLPTQLFEAGINLVLFFVLMWLWKRRKFDGQVFAVYLIFYGILRGLLELMRGDIERGMYFGGMVSTSQLISIGIIAAGIILLTNVGSLRTKLDPNPESTGIPMTPETETQPEPNKKKKRKKKK